MDELMNSDDVRRGTSLKSGITLLQLSGIVLFSFSFSVYWLIFFLSRLHMKQLRQEISSRKGSNSKSSGPASSCVDNEAGITVSDALRQPSRALPPEIVRVSKKNKGLSIEDGSIVIPDNLHSSTRQDKNCSAGGVNKENEIHHTTLPERLLSTCKHRQSLSLEEVSLFYELMSGLRSAVGNALKMGDSEANTSSADAKNHGILNDFLGKLDLVCSVVEEMAQKAESSSKADPLCQNDDAFLASLDAMVTEATEIMETLVSRDSLSGERVFSLSLSAEQMDRIDKWDEMVTDIIYTHFGWDPVLITVNGRVIRG